MAVTVIVNSMTVSHEGSSGMSIAFPDVCKTPVLGVPVPIPYPNIAKSLDLSKGSKKVKCDGQKVVLKSSEISRSMGDEPGVQMGLLSNKQMGKAKFENYSFDVKFEGKNVCRLLDPTTQNRSSLNTAAFAHLQPGSSASAGGVDPIKDACDEVKKKNKKEQEAETKSGDSGPKTSGIIPSHWTAMQGFLSQLDPSYMIYFRASGPHVGKWIEKHLTNKSCHEPKPHEWTDGLSCKEGREAKQKTDLQGWLIEEEGAHGITGWLRSVLSKSKKEAAKAIEKLRAMGVITPQPPSEVLTMKPLYGVIISSREAYGLGRPILGIRKWNDLDFRGNWMTGDYDMMDIVKAGKMCERPSAAEYGLLKFGLNSAMGWPGIQHGPQSTWNTRGDTGFKGRENFSVMQIINDWLQFGENAKKIMGKEEAKGRIDKKPARSIVKKEDPKDDRMLDLIDDALTILAPSGGLHLKALSDYWDALVCCGCLEKAGEQDTSQLEDGSKAASDAQYGKTAHAWEKVPSDK